VSRGRAVNQQQKSTGCGALKKIVKTSKNPLDISIIA
jgi:hypothetical protein